LIICHCKKKSFNTKTIRVSPSSPLSKSSCISICMGCWQEKQKKRRRTARDRLRQSGLSRTSTTSCWCTARGASTRCPPSWPPPASVSGHSTWWGCGASPAQWWKLRHLFTGKDGLGEIPRVYLWEGGARMRGMRDPGNLEEGKGNCWTKRFLLFHSKLCFFGWF
jgi:hypothetical protein